MSIIVSCAGDTQLAEKLGTFLLSKSVDVSIKIDEIAIETDAQNIKSADVRNLLTEFLATNSDLTQHSITELGDLFTVGISQSIDKVVLSCEMCGYLAHDEDEMIIHKRIHGLFLP